MQLPNYLMGQVNGFGDGLDNFTNALYRYQDGQRQRERMAMDQERLGLERSRFGLQERDSNRLFAQAQAREQEFKNFDPSTIGDPMIAQAVKMAGSDAAPQMILQHRNAQLAQNKPTDDIREFEYAKRGGYGGSFENWQKQIKQKGAEYGKQTTVVQDADGNFYTLHTGSDGSSIARPLQLGQGGVPMAGMVSQSEDGRPGPAPIKLSPSKGTKQYGSEIADVATGRTVRNIAPQIAEKEAAEEVGKTQGKAIGDLSRVADNADRAMKTIEQIRRHPGKEYATGAWSAVPLDRIPGTDARGFVNLVEQAKGQTFLEAFNSLRGGGAITEAEGQKATQALARLDRGQSKADYDAALNDLEDVVRNGMVRARQMAGGNFRTPAPTMTTGASQATPRLPNDPAAAAAAYNQLPSGARYIDPNGYARTKQ